MGEEHGVEVFPEELAGSGKHGREERGGGAPEVVGSMDWDRERVQGILAVKDSRAESRTATIGFRSRWKLQGSVEEAGAKRRRKQVQ